MEEKKKKQADKMLAARKGRRRNAENCKGEKKKKTMAKKKKKKKKKQGYIEETKKDCKATAAKKLKNILSEMDGYLKPKHHHHHNKGKKNTAECRFLRYPGQWRKAKEAVALKQEIKRIKSGKAGEMKIRRNVAEGARQPNTTLESVVNFH